MAKTKLYQHYCPVARSLEVIGEKWSLLIVRDLLFGPQRFTDLLRSESAITPKWLTLRLRELEEVGIVERDSEEGRREVWYRLTPKGRALAPVVESLAIWGLEHVQRPPQPGESVDPFRLTAATTVFLDERHVSLPRPRTYVICLSSGHSTTVRFGGTRWSVARGDEGEADVRIDATPDAWLAFLLAQPDERADRARALQISGAGAAVKEFIATFGLRIAGAPGTGSGARTAVA